MAYNKFTFQDIEERFGMLIDTKQALFTDVSASDPPQVFRENFQRNFALALAINTEKARSEFIIAPILAELRAYHHDQISLFSGIHFNIDRALGLSGTCDYLISRSNEQLVVKTPVVVIVEAKNEDIPGGFGQCMAEMIAAGLFNQRRKNIVERIYGVITSGDHWKFLQMEEKTILIDRLDFYLPQQFASVFAILSHMVNH